MGWWSDWGRSVTGGLRTGGLYNVGELAAGAMDRERGPMSPNDDQLNADLIRRDFADWSTRFKPIEEELVGMYGNQQLIREQQNQALRDVNEGFNSASESTDRRLAGLGITLTPEQQQARQRSEGLERGLGAVEAYNRTGRRAEDRNQMLLTGAGRARSSMGGLS